MIRLAALLLACTATALPAQDVAPPPPLKTDGGIRPDAVRAHVAFLADDLLEGRDGGTRGYDLAAHYVATQFEALGLTPGVGGKWYQTLTFQKARLDPAKPASLTIGGVKFDNGGDVVITPDGRFQDQVIEADMVFVGFGIDAPAQGYDDYKGVDVKGKFVVMLRGVPEGTPSELGASFGRDKARMASARGAIGILTIPTPTVLKQYPWDRMLKNIGLPQQRVIEPDGQPRLAAPEVRASAYANGPAAEALFAGSGTTLAKVFAASAKKGAKLRSMALKPRLTFTQSSLVETSRSPNVVGVLPGSDPTLAAEYVLVSAHLDHVGVHADAPGTDKVFNGAMDNAAGVATMIEAARAFVYSGVRPRRSVMFVALTNEEDGLLGSDYLARHPVVPTGARVVANVNLDMPVLLYKLDDVIAFGAEQSTIGEAVGRAAVKAGITLSPDFMPEENIFVRSDHYSFVKQGVPAVMLATGSKNDGVKIYKEFLATKYHTVGDQPSLPFNWEAAAKFAHVNYLVARDLADAPTAPLWYADSPFGAQFAKDQPKAKRPTK